MPLKLFHATGFESSILAPGETRVAPHPLALMLGVGLWFGATFNEPLWRELLGFGSSGPGGLRVALWVSGIAAGAGIAFLSLFGWRRTLKPAATLLLLAGALAACTFWAQSLPLDAAVLGRRPANFLPAWPSLLRWQVAALLLGLGLAPMVAVWNAKPRRLSGPAQLRVNAIGVVLGVVLAGACTFALGR